MALNDQESFPHESKQLLNHLKEAVRQGDFDYQHWLYRQSQSSSLALHPTHTNNSTCLKEWLLSVHHWQRRNLWQSIDSEDVQSRNHACLLCFQLRWACHWKQHFLTVDPQHLSPADRLCHSSHWSSSHPEHLKHHQASRHAPTSIATALTSIATVAPVCPAWHSA